MSYIGTAINSSPTIVGKAGADIVDGSFLAAAYDVNGDIVIAGEGVNAIGILPVETNSTTAGNDVAVQVKDIGLWKTGTAVTIGAELSSDANGKCIPATSGSFIVAVALETAEAADQVIQVQVCKAGYKA